jgi:NADH dehydrogenase (ubiquinone) Fe-S protein 2
MKSDFKHLYIFSLNFGPQHPSTHGVLRLILTLIGEIIIKADPHIGLLHRGTEKLLENKTYLRGLPYFDRLDYVSCMVQEHIYCLSLEFLKSFIVNSQVQIIRVLFSEITRVLNHLMALTTHALDVGALTPFLWAFEEREKLMNFYELISGARMHASFFRPGGVFKNWNLLFLEKLLKFSSQFPYRILEVESLLTNNRIWKERLINIGSISKKQVSSWSFSGVLLRSTGVFWDLRKIQPYESYNNFKFKIPISFFGDSYDRYLLRIEEMKQSILIIKQGCLYLLSLQNTNCNKPIAELFQNNTKMAKLIQHFKFYSEGFFLKSNNIYLGIEAPKGEMGIFLTTNNDFKPYRCKIRAPGFFHLNAINSMVQYHTIADAVVIIGTQDIVFGEVDR